MRRLLLSLTLSLAGIACGSPRTDQPPRFDPSTLNEARSLQGRLNVTVTGALELDFDRRVPIQIFLGGNDPRVPAALKLLSVGLLNHVDIGGSRRFRLAFDLLGYLRDGDYVIPATGQSTPTAEGIPELPPGIVSNVFVEVLSTDGQAIEGIVRYDVLPKECALRVIRRGREGLLTCPELRSSAGEAVHLRMEWKT